MDVYIYACVLFHVKWRMDVHVNSGAMQYAKQRLHVHASANWSFNALPTVHAVQNVSEKNLTN